MAHKESFPIHLIRGCAILMVVLLHVSAPVRDQWQSMANANFIIGAIFDSLGRSGVPLFLMISGALLLGREEDPLTFYKKRFSRIILPFLFWSFLYAFFSSWQNNQAVHIGKLINSILWGPSYYHLWYLYMLMGIYLIAPFIQVLVKNLSKRHLEILLVLWFIFKLMLPQLSGQIKIWLNTDFGIGIHSHFPDLYLGYFLLGYYLFTYRPFSQITKPGMWFIGIALIQAMLSLLIYWKTNAYQELMIMPSSPTVVLQAALFTCWAQRMQKQSFTRIVTLISGLSFGVYLLHPILIELLKLGVFGVSISAHMADTIVSIPLTFVLVTFFSFCAIYLGQRIPFFKKLIS